MATTNIKKSFEYENGFYLTSDSYRLGRALAHYEIYKKCLNTPGDIVEMGVFKGASFMRFIMFMQLFEGKNSRKIIGFDTFGKFPSTKRAEDKKNLQRFINDTGNGESISLEELNRYIVNKDFVNFELVKGDIVKTVPKYVKNNPALRISLLNIDTDIYEPAKTVMKYIAPKVVRGGIIVFDDYGFFAGETKLADEYCEKYGFNLKRLNFCPRPVYLVKN